MARSYSVSSNCTNTQSTTNAMLNIVATAATQPSIFEINSGSDATPANQAVKVQLQKFSAIGAQQGAITPFQINAAAGTAIASVFTACPGASALPTYTGGAFFLTWAQNQNTAYRWVASSPQRMLMLPSSSGQGAGFMPTVVTSAFNQVLGVFVEE